MKRFLLAACLLPLLPCPAAAWGCKGHPIAALIAAAHLAPQAAAAAGRILAAEPLAPDRGCPAAGLPPIAAAANWADAVRDARAAHQHYVNLPFAADPRHFDYASACGGTCVTAAIRRYSQQLRSASAPRQRAQALRYLIHFVADVHQPLHAIDRADDGGNCLPYAAALDARYPHAADPSASTPEEWAWQSHALARESAYAPLRLAYPRSCAEPGPVIAIHAAYIRQAAPVIARQLDRAGLRLAARLNQILAPPARGIALGELNQR